MSNNKLTKEITMNKGRNRRKRGFIGKETLIVKFPFLKEWQKEDVNQLCESLKRKNRSEERFRRVSQQEIARMKEKNTILALLNDNEVKGCILSYRMSLLDRFNEESKAITRKTIKKKLLKQGFSRPYIYKALFG
ncbi:MAG: hypothetical protein GXP45_06725 [bacterium]|nr:hypothetical protein [bacterium]